MMPPLPEFNDYLYWRLPLPAINLESESTEENWVERLIKTLAARKFGILLSQSQQIFRRQWNDSLPDDWLAKLPAEVIVEDDNIRPPTVKLAPVDQELVIPTPDEEEEEEEASVAPEPAPVDQGLVLPTPAEEEEEASVSPELTMTDRLLQLLEEDIIQRMKKRVQDLVIPEWKVKLVQSYNWP